MNYKCNIIMLLNFKIDQNLYWSFSKFNYVFMNRVYFTNTTHPLSGMENCNAKHLINLINTNALLPSPIQSGFIIPLKTNIL